MRGIARPPLHKRLCPTGPASRPKIPWGGAIFRILSLGGRGMTRLPERAHNLASPTAKFTFVVLPSAINQDHGFLDRDS